MDKQRRRTRKFFFIQLTPLNVLVLTVALLGSAYLFSELLGVSKCIPAVIQKVLHG